MKLHTWTVGNGPRTAALVHGATKAADVWRDVARILVDEYDLTVVLLDQRGHGRSPRASSYRVADFTDDLVETLPVGLDFLVGASLGGLAGAWACARLRPKHYIGLDPAFELKASAGLSAFMLSLLGPLERRVVNGLFRLAAPDEKGAAPDTQERVAAMFKDWDASMMSQLVRSARRQPFPLAAPVVASTLLLADPSVVVSEAMARDLRTLGWDVRVKPGAVHDMHLQDPPGVVAMLDDVFRAKARSGGGGVAALAAASLD
jgi:pimeloyl-ACP methyl ester carboxylesterase